MIQQESLDGTPEERCPQLKRFFILALGLLLVLLMASYILVSFPLNDILRGQIESKPLDETNLELDNFTIFFQKETLNQLKTIYFAEQKVEFSVCFLGEKKGDDYFITSLYQPRMFDQAFNHVSSEPCNLSTLIVLHSHPYKSCLASETDLATLKEAREGNSDLLMVVMCEPERFSVY